ncbi:hypothetical protein [Pseudoduganella namucuonensis]|uniref:Uncharacterized protein n=1 Tax=Pseudoduganella namucuonensis TaxID=1035707 RepID=A0A1I7M7G9_9BURK|nr:hypothetical protein [Pseudoduganella namucuonensis]SFV17881.1 hypothetical protein SAMN05216552_10803 [Pseudoduganella namucuonensis]
MNANDIKDLMLGAALVGLGYMLWRHLEKRRQEAQDAREAATVPEEVKQYGDPGYVYQFPQTLEELMNGAVGSGLTMPIVIGR